MANRTGNYCAFYVKEPFIETNLGAYATHDFCFYNTLRMWRGRDSSFPFVDSHDKTYNVRDNSSWNTLQSRLRERLRNSKNIVLFLSSITIESKALKEELEYGIHILGLPVIVVYPDFAKTTDITDLHGIKSSIKELWNNVPTFKKYMHEVATVHVPLNQSVIKNALSNDKFSVITSTTTKIYHY